MIANLEILMGEIGRQNNVIFPSHVTLLSEHCRTHIIMDDLVKYGDLKASERGTKRMNQELIQIQHSIKRIPDKKAQANTMMRTIQLRREATKPAPMYTKNKKK